MGDLSNTTINGVSYDFKDAGAARQSHSHTKSQITDFPTSMPASDVPAWAKASSKPSYTASEVGAIATTAKGAASGVAELDANGKVPSSQLPSFVDDVLEYSAKSSFPATGETGKIYVDTSDNKTYRWSGSAYVEISSSLALGETSSTAYRGDRGKAAYDHSQTTSGNPHNVTAAQTGAVPNTAAGVSAAINQLTTGDSAPTDNDYYVSQYAGGGSSTTTYHRRPVSKLWEYIKSKLASKGSATQPVYFSNGVPVATTYTLGKSVPSNAKFTDTTYSSKSAASGGTDVSLCTTGEKYTWNNKGTYSKPSGGIPKTDLASAVQTSLGLADGALQHTTVSGSPDLDTYLTTGIYHITTSTATHAPTTNHATLFVDATVGTPYQIFKPDNVDSPWYTRHRSGSAWTSWVAMKFTDTTYSAATTSAAGLMSAADKTKLNGIATGAQVNSITGVKGNAENSYRTGNVNLTPANIGAAAASDVAVSTINPSDFFTPYSNGTILSNTVLFKQGKHIFGLIGFRATTATPVIGTIKSPYLPAISTNFYGIEYVYSSSAWTPSTYIISNDQMRGNGRFSEGAEVYVQINYITA